ncbi:MAG: AraC family transcriptional regulator [Clostridiales bacterium]|jgi:AraC-like DNA-binding protein|nr:AraC family transcriptional regulator [Clostridiales bacterium]
MVKLLYYTFRTDRDIKRQRELFPRHLHDFYEIYLFLNGDVKYVIEDKSFEMRPSRLLLIKPYTYHFPLFMGGSEYYERISMHFAAEGDEGFVERLFGRLEMIDLDKYPDLLSIFSLFIKYSPSLGEEQAFSYAQACLTQFLLTIDSVAGEVKAENVGNIPIIIKRAIEFINNNIEKRITLNALSEKLYVNKGYLSKLFMRHFKMPVGTYIRNKQLLLADALIKNGTPPTDVYLKCGFSDYSSFFRAYVKMFGYLPSKAKKLR